MHEWMTDNNQTPLIVVDANHAGVMVPAEAIEDSRVVLNIAWSATRGLIMGNEEIEFQARFGGVAQSVSLPVAAVLGIYARESGQGMVFQAEPGSESVAAESTQPAEIHAARENSADNDDPDEPKPPSGAPHLRVVK